MELNKHYNYLLKEMRMPVVWGYEGEKVDIAYYEFAGCEKRRLLFFVAQGDNGFSQLSY